jgi:hypothetical protein
MISHAIRQTVEVRCRLELNYVDEREAEKVLKAVAVDNEGFVAARREGSSIISEISSENILSLVQTIEDYLACVSIAEKTIRAAGERPREREPPRPSRKRASRRES